MMLGFLLIVLFMILLTLFLSILLGILLKVILVQSVGGLFSSSHMNTNIETLITDSKFLEDNRITIMGHLDMDQGNLYKGNSDRFLDRLVYKETQKDEFWLDLKANVDNFIITNNETIHYSAFEGKMYLLYYSVIFILLSYLTWVEYSLLASILLGFHMICAATNMSHMVTHFGFTKNKLLDYIAAHFFDLAGFSWLQWQIIHQTHHNQPHSPIDYQTNQYVIRIHSYMPHKKHHKYQKFYFWATVLVYHLLNTPLCTIWLFKNKEFIHHNYELITHIFCKLILFSLVILCGFLYGTWNAIIIFLIYSISYSLTAFILLYNDHEDTHNVLALDSNINQHHNKLSWAEIQVRTSNNWYPTNWLLSFIEFHYGYFNFHIEHHLFPTFKPILLKKISPIVKGICEKHDIPYISTPFFEVQKSFQRHITKMGIPPEN